VGKTKDTSSKEINRAIGTGNIKIKTLQVERFQREVSSQIVVFERIKIVGGKLKTFQKLSKFGYIYSQKAKRYDLDFIN